MIGLMESKRRGKERSLEVLEKPSISLPGAGAFDTRLEVETFGSGQMDEGADLKSDRVILAKEEEHFALMELRPRAPSTMLRQ